MRWLLCASVLIALSGCRMYTLDSEGRIAARASDPIDAQLPQQPPAKLPSLGAANREVEPRATFGSRVIDASIILAQGKKEQNPETVKDKKGVTLTDRLQFPEGVLGFKVPDVKLPPATAPRKDIDAAIEKYFPKLPEVPALPEARMGPQGRPLTLTDLQQVALQTNPLIRQAHQDIENARGRALQARLYPNPIIGYEADTIGSGKTAGQQGGFVNQSIVTMGKLQIAGAAAQVEVQIAEERLKKVEADLRSQVRGNYFNVLAARKNYETIGALTQLTDAAYKVLFEQMKAGQVATYEPMQLRVLSEQARGQLWQAYSRYQAAWKQLAASLGTPQMPLTKLAGQLDMPVPLFDQQRVLDFVLANHTDVISAQLEVEKGRYLLRLSEVIPYPDVNVNLVVQKDYTTPPFGTSANVLIGVPIPLWDRNQGNIHSARAVLQRVIHDNERVRNDLTSRVAEAFGRYDANRKLIELYKDKIIPNQVRAYRAAVARHDVDKASSYNDLVMSQQTLANLITSYLATLNDQWTAVVDIGALMQTRDLFQLQAMEDVPPVPDVLEMYRERRGLRR